MAVLAPRSTVSRIEPLALPLRSWHSSPESAEARTTRPSAPVRRSIIMAERAEPRMLEHPMEERTQAAWNIPSLIAIGIVLVALLSLIVQGGSSFFGYLLIAAFIAGLIGLLSAIARKERGKGFAIAALVFSIGFVIILLAALSKLS